MDYGGQHESFKVQIQGGALEHSPVISWFITPEFTSWIIYWLVASTLPLWKMMEFVSWGYYSQ